MIEAVARTADEERKILHGEIRNSTKGGPKRNDKKKKKKKEPAEGKNPERGEKVRGAIALRDGDASAPCDVCGSQEGSCRSVKKKDGQILSPTTVMDLCAKAQTVLDATYTDNEGMKRGFCLNCKGFCYGRAKYREANPEAAFKGGQGCLLCQAKEAT
jgi:hypothetical protein